MRPSELAIRMWLVSSFHIHPAFFHPVVQGENLFIDFREEGNLAVRAPILLPARSGSSSIAAFCELQFHRRRVFPIWRCSPAVSAASSIAFGVISSVYE